MGGKLMSNSINDIKQLISEVRGDLLNKPNVVATGVGYKVSGGKKTEDLSIICSVENKKLKKSFTTDELIPTSIQNVPLDVHPIGVISAFKDPKKKYRPAPGGVSIGHNLITAGTLGCIVKKNGKLFILSNNHVLANSNDSELGDPILQPGPADGGTYPENHIANLSEFVPIEFSDLLSSNFIIEHITDVLNKLLGIHGTNTILQAVNQEELKNLVDCALAVPLDENDVKKNLLQIESIEGLEEATLGMSVKKSGRTTALTTGTIEQIDVTAKVNYGLHKTAVFTDQLMTSPMSEGGDSGSVVISKDNKLVGLLFAGSNGGTIVNRIQNVFDKLQVTLP